MYRYQKEIPEKLVALLYATGFIAGAGSASFVGYLADHYGRRLACVLYCACYTISCLTMLSDDLPILFVGRVFGGCATTLLFSAFEAWVITDYHRRRLDKSSLALSHIFANMTALSSTVAIASGVVGDILVSVFETRICPFVVSIICCLCAAVLILFLWQENYGQSSVEPSATLVSRQSIWPMLKNGRVIALGITSCCFEGAMYLFVFFWSATLASARSRSGMQEELPFGLIFSCFMCAMMAGSALFSLSNKPHSSKRAALLLQLVVLIASGSLILAVVFKREHLLFWTLCLIEITVGAYYPSMAYLKSESIGDEIRGSVYSLLRLPLNVFVVVVHSLDEEGWLIRTSLLPIANA